MKDINIKEAIKELQALQPYKVLSNEATTTIINEFTSELIEYLNKVILKDNMLHKYFIRQLLDEGEDKLIICINVTYPGQPFSILTDVQTIFEQKYNISIDMNLRSKITKYINLSEIQDRLDTSVITTHHRYNNLKFTKHSLIWIEHYC